MQEQQAEHLRAMMRMARLVRARRGLEDAIDRQQRRLRRLERAAHALAQKDLSADYIDDVIVDTAFELNRLMAQRGSVWS